MTSVQLVSSWNAVCGLIEDCDFYVELTIAGQTYPSSTVEADGDSSTFDHSEWADYNLVPNVFASDLKNGFTLEVMDEDWGPDSSVGKAEITVTDAMLSLGYATLMVQKLGGDVASVNLKFEKLVTN